MRTHAIACIILAATTVDAVAHDDHSHPIVGEKKVEEKSPAEVVLDFLFPEAEAAANFSTRGAYRYISGNGYPDYAPGAFPNRQNPHSIRRKNYRLKVPVNPRKNGRARATGSQPFGISLDGVLFDPGTAEYWNGDRRSGWRYEAMTGACRLGLDRNNAHVQPDGTYHYHGVPRGLARASGRAPTLVGYAADGFPIYGPRGYRDAGDAASGLTTLRSSYVVHGRARNGGPGGRANGVFTQDWVYRAGRGDLDQCNGRIGVTPEYPNGTYYYVLTETFPFIPRCWVGTPESSFARLKRGPSAAGAADGRPARAGAGPKRHMAGGRPPMGRRAGGSGGRRSPCQGT